MIWASLRHGTRYPDRKTLEDTKKLHEIKDLIVKHHEENKSKYFQLLLYIFCFNHLLFKIKVEISSNNVNCFFLIVLIFHP